MASALQFPLLLQLGFPSSAFSFSRRLVGNPSPFCWFCDPLQGKKKLVKSLRKTSENAKNFFPFSQMIFHKKDQSPPWTKKSPRGSCFVTNDLRRNRTLLTVGQKNQNTWYWMLCRSHIPTKSNLAIMLLSDYTCPMCSRSLHHCCGTRVDFSSSSPPRHGDTLFFFANIVISRLVKILMKQGA